MHLYRRVLILFLSGFFAGLAPSVRAAEGLLLPNVWAQATLSGNDQAQGCDLTSYDFTFAGQTVGGLFHGCCGIFYFNQSPPLTNNLAGESSYHGSIQMTQPGELCCAPSLTVNDVPGCFDVIIEYDFCSEDARPMSFDFFTSITRNSNSTPIATWSVKDSEGAPASISPQEGIYQLPADGMSTASPTLAPGVGTVTWVFTGDSLGCTLSASGLLTSGTNVGTVQVTAQSTNTDLCLVRDFYFELMEPKCDACAGGEPCPTLTGVNSLDAKFNLGPSRRGAPPAYIQLKAFRPGPALGTPSPLRCNYIRPDLEKITNAAGLRQVRALEQVVNILTNTVSSYTLEYYAITNLMPKSNGLYRFSGSPWKTVNIQLVGGDTNQVRIQDSLEPAPRDFRWITNGWTLITGNGLRSETLTETNVSGVRTEIRSIRNAAGVLQRQSAQRWQHFAYGQRLISETNGTGTATRINTYTYDANGRLTAVVRGDGSWENFTYDSLGRQVNRYSPFLNSAPTTSANSCRLTVSTYTNNVVPGSGDDFKQEPYTPRRVTESILNVEVSRRYTVVKAGERREIICPNPGAAWNDTNNIVTTTFFRTDALYLGKPAKILNPDGTVQLFTYSEAALPDATSPLHKKVTMLSGAPDATTNGIVRGAQDETWTDKAGRLLLRLVTDVPSNLVLSRESYTYDSQSRLVRTDYLDGTSVIQTYPDLADWRVKTTIFNRCPRANPSTSRGRFAKGLVVQTYPLPGPDSSSMIPRHYVSALFKTSQRWQRASLLECRAKPAAERPARRPTPRPLSR